MNKEQQELLDEAYVYYEKEILRQRKIQREKVQKLRSQGKRIKVAAIPLLSQEEFINKCKNDKGFSEKWGLTIKEQIIGKRFTLDLGSLAPVQMVVKEVTKDKVIVEYLNSTPGRLEQFTISDFEYLAMIKIESYE
jgi:hypothetical protein